MKKLIRFTPLLEHQKRMQFLACSLYLCARTLTEFEINDEKTVCHNMYEKLDNKLEKKVFDRLNEQRSFK